MANLILFTNSFLSYLILFIFISTLCIIATFIGIRLRIHKDKAINKVELFSKIN